MSQVFTKDNFVAKLSLVEGAQVLHDLKAEIDQHKILDRNYLYYSFKWAFAFASVGITFYLMLVAQSYWVFFLLNILLGFFVTHFGALAHDAGHQQIAKTPISNDIMGIFAGFFIAVTYGGWKEKHNAHHAFPNTHLKDPDLEVPIALSIERYNRLHGPLDFLRRHQAYLFFPAALLEGYSLQFRNSIRYLIKEWKKGFHALTLIETLILIIAVSVWYVLPFHIFSLDRAITFVLVTPMVFGFYLTNVFAPNHKGMPELMPDVPISFLERQIITARNINTSWWATFIYLGLNYQIEHHLFPSCPRGNIKRTEPFVRKVCDKTGLEYNKSTIFQSQKMILSELYKVSQAAKLQETK